MPALGAGGQAAGGSKKLRKFTLELKEVKFDNQAAEMADKAGRLAERLTQALAVSSGRSKIYQLISKSDRPLKKLATHSLSLHFKLFDDSWVLTYQVISNESMQVIKQDVMEFANPFDSNGITEMLVPVIESALML